MTNLIKVTERTLARKDPSSEPKFGVPSAIVKRGDIPLLAEEGNADPILDTKLRFGTPDVSRRTTVIEESSVSRVFPSSDG